ncbi:MAG: VCBS repeat-containing protein [Fimbriimonas sp.]
MIATLTLLALTQGFAFQKVVVDTRFISEGVAVADINRDKKLDIFAGNLWYEAPTWRPHEIATVKLLDPKTQYQDSFHNWADDLNKDGWPDQIVIGMPGEKAIWRENPQGKDEPWKEHLIWHSACNESPLYEDLFKNGKRVLIMGTDDEYLAWFEPAADPYAKWQQHNIGQPKGPGSQRYSHGLGVGDINGENKNEVLTTGGYYSQPNWTFTKADLGPDCAHMLAIGKEGILTTSAHARGFWWFKPKADGTYERQTIDETISGTHSASLLKIGNTINLITGKRKWAHPPGVDQGSEEPSWLVRYEYKGSKWTRHLIDENSGVGTQFVVKDINGDKKEDIVTSNKNGVFLFLQK